MQLLVLARGERITEGCVHRPHGPPRLLQLVIPRVLVPCDHAAVMMMVVMVRRSRAGTKDLESTRG